MGLVTAASPPMFSTMFVPSGSLSASQFSLFGPPRALLPPFLLASLLGFVTDFLVFHTLPCMYWVGCYSGRSGIEVR